MLLSLGGTFFGTVIIKEKPLFEMRSTVVLTELKTEIGVIMGQYQQGPDDYSWIQTRTKCPLHFTTFKARNSRMNN